MGDLYEVTDFKLLNRIRKRLEFYLNELNLETKEEFEKLIAVIVIPAANYILKENRYEVSVEDLSYEEQVEFYNMLFREVCYRLVALDPLTKDTSRAFKTEVMKHMEKSREIDKDRLQYDEDLYDYRPDLSEYEFDLPRMVDDIDYYINVILDQGNKPKKR